MSRKWLYKTYHRWFGKDKDYRDQVEAKESTLPTYLLEGDDKENPMLTKTLCGMLGVMRENPIMFNDMSDLLISLSKEYLSGWEHVAVKHLNMESFDKLITHPEVIEAYGYYASIGPVTRRMVNISQMRRTFEHYGVLYVEGITNEQ